MQGVDLFITITDRSRAEQFAAWFRTHGISLVLTALGQGTATTEVLDFLGLEATEKAVLFCVSPRSPRLVRQAARDLWLDVPGQGVLMTVPVNSIGGSTAKEYLLHEQEGETAMEREIAHDLIVVIANQGSTDLVMDAAREAGATGGTVIHAKGTGTDLVRKFFGVSIASEQEMVFILARSEAKKPIMKAIMAKAGIQSAAQSLVLVFEFFAKPWVSRQIQTEFRPAFVYDKGSPQILWRFRKDEYQMQKVSKEYLLLFNAITDAEESLRRLQARLIDAQQKAEELFITDDEADPLSRNI